MSKQVIGEFHEQTVNSMSIASAVSGIIPELHEHSKCSEWNCLSIASAVSGIIPELHEHSKCSEWNCMIM